MDVPTVFHQVVTVRGRRTPDVKAQSARQPRKNGFSIREIARRLHVSRSAVHHAVQDIHARGPDEAEAGKEPEKIEEVSQPSVSSDIPNTEDKSMAELFNEELAVLAYDIRLARESGQTEMMEKFRRLFDQVAEDKRSYLRRRLHLAELGLGLDEPL